MTILSDLCLDEGLLLTAANMSGETAPAKEPEI
jgi:hypothetical protein